MKSLNILFLTSFDFDVNGEKLERIREIAPDASVTAVPREEATPAMVKDAEIIIGRPKREYIRESDSLKWMQLPSAGADGYTDKSLFRNENFILTNCSGVYGMPIAEHVFGMIFAFNKNFYYHFKNRAEKKWDRKLNRADFCGSAIGIIGLGDIGSQIAKGAKGFGATVLAVKRTPDHKPEFVDELYGEDGIDTVMAKSDYVVIALPHTGTTKGIITEERLRKMKPGSFFINIARGDIVDQDALIKALREKRIAGAGLDATSPEPLPSGSPLWEMENVIITPHSSGFSPTNIDRRFEIFYENLKRYLTGEKLTHIVDMDKGY